MNPEIFDLYLGKYWKLKPGWGWVKDGDGLIPRRLTPLWIWDV